MTTLPLGSMYPPFVPDLHGSKTFDEVKGDGESRRDDHPASGVHVAELTIHGNHERRFEVHVLACESSGEGQENPDGDRTNFALHDGHPTRLDTAARLFGRYLIRFPIRIVERSPVRNSMNRPLRNSGQRRSL